MLTITIRCSSANEGISVLQWARPKRAKRTPWRYPAPPKVFASSRSSARWRVCARFIEGNLLCTAVRVQIVKVSITAVKFMCASSDFALSASCVA